MKKTVVLFIVIIALVLGYSIGKNRSIFSEKPSTPPYTYNLQVPDSVTGKSPAFANIVKVISPLVVNISTSKTVTREESSPLKDFFDAPLKDFFEPFKRPETWKERSLGSGVIVSSEGYILTNNHVVEKADEITVTLYDKQTYRGKIVGTDPKTDIAVIKISAKDLPAIKWGNSEKLEVGEFVLAFGNPFSLGHTVTMGIVSAIGRANVGIADYEDFIQTDAAINPGNSGGPLVNIKGELVGVNTAIFSRTGGYQGIGFAVPSNMARSVMDQLINDGKVTRGWLGVSIQNLTPELSKEFGLKKPSGALVTDIFEGSPAEKSDLKRGDVILEIDGKIINNVESLRNTIAQNRAGNSVKLKVLRDNKTLSITIKITEFPQDLAQATPGLQEDDSTAGEDNLLAGFSVTDLTRTISQQLGLSRNEKGVVIVKVTPYSAAEDSGLKKGDVIQEINKKRVKSLNDFNKIAPQLKKGDTALLFINRSGNKFYITLKLYS